MSLPGPLPGVGVGVECCGRGRLGDGVVKLSFLNVLFLLVKLSFLNVLFLLVKLSFLNVLFLLLNYLFLMYYFFC